MPSVNQGGGYTLTFSRKNQVVKDLLDSKKAEGVVVTEYICNAIKFYEQYKDSIENTMSMNMVEDLVNKKMELLKKELLSIPLAIDKEEMNFNLEDVSPNLETSINIEDD
ncbi:hypothetical protein G9F73_019405 [Clostridium estertheticum]|uniref:hypothetical protein n=1 Tax=Clostridium estertheticum TaxID=238834 RepID=UPI0013EED1D6|nr:hypothetical protein [Clostridium estertheticum]MBZ9609896.1 hypothetical protein [Clostridium estertheticum]